MAMKRNDTGKERVGFRTSRMYNDDGAWFFRTREGDAVGPFRDELEASTQLEVYIRLLDAGLHRAQDGISSGGLTRKSAV
jgi:hypothetical protein